MSSFGCSTCFPDVRCELEHVEALLTERRAGVAADRRGRCRIVEADAGCVVVDDDDLALGERRRDAGQRQGRDSDPLIDEGAHGLFLLESGLLLRRPESGSSAPCRASTSCACFACSTADSPVAHDEHVAAVLGGRRDRDAHVAAFEIHHAGSRPAASPTSNPSARFAGHLQQLLAELLLRRRSDLAAIERAAAAGAAASSSPVAT